MHRSIVACLIAGSALAQVPSAKSFLPNEYRNVVTVDFVGLRDRGVWADLEVSVLKAAFKAMEKELGCPLAALDRLTMIAQPAAEAAGHGNGRFDEVIVLEGNRPLGVPPRVSGGRFTEAEVGDHKVWRGHNGVFVQPRPEWRVEGAAGLVEPVLQGKPNAGVPCADVMSLCSGRGDNLVFFAFDLANDVVREGLAKTLFEGTIWPEGDAPTFLAARVRSIGDADDPHLEVEAVLRHQRDGAGMKVSEEAVAALMKRLQEDKTMRFVRPTLQRVETRRDRGDLVLRVDLGRSRDAVGQLAVLAAPMIRRAATTVEEVQIEVAAPAAPVPAPGTEPKK